MSVWEEFYNFRSGLFNRAGGSTAISCRHFCVADILFSSMMAAVRFTLAGSILAAFYVADSIVLIDAPQLVVAFQKLHSFVSWPSFS